MASHACIFIFISLTQLAALLQAGAQRPLPPPYVRHLYCDLAVRCALVDCLHKVPCLSSPRMLLHPSLLLSMPACEKHVVHEMHQGVGCTASASTANSALLQLHTQRCVPSPCRSGAAMAHFVRGEVEPWRWQVHAFQGAGVPGDQVRMRHADEPWTAGRHQEHRRACCAGLLIICRHETAYDMAMRKQTRSA